MDKYISKAIIFLRDYVDDDVTDIDKDSHLIADLGLNSLQLVEIVNDAEFEFDVTITDDELDSILTVGDIAELLQKKGIDVD